MELILGALGEAPEFKAFHDCGVERSECSSLLKGDLLFFLDLSNMLFNSVRFIPQNLEMAL